MKLTLSDKGKRVSVKIDERDLDHAKQIEFIINILLNRLNDMPGTPTTADDL